MARIKTEKNISRKDVIVTKAAALFREKGFKAALKNGPLAGFEVEGIKVIDPLTIQFTLLEPNSIFLYNLARPFTFVFAKEAYEKYGQEMRVKAVGTGPFVISSVDEGTSVNLLRNPNYYLKDENGTQLP